MEIHHISQEQLTFERIEKILKGNLKIELSESSKQNIIKCREYLDKKVQNTAEPVYGVTTGFGSLCDRTISIEQLSALQRNIVMSHACGMGEEVPQEIVKIMLLLKIQSLSYGKSGVQLQTAQRLVDMFNNNVIPVVYQQGSLGASGDLAPLAHLVLPVINMGEVYFENKKYKSSEINAKFGWKEIELQSKEGLALLNGTQFMSSYATWLIIKVQKLSKLADIIGAVSLEAFDGRIEPFFEIVHKARPHKGQLKTAERFRDLLADSEMIRQPKKHVQDPYSFRCIPQVHGASKDAFEYCKGIFEIEINSVTDNPNVFPDEDLIVSAGNFHGQPLALSLDFLTIALAELGSISERRTYQLIGGKRGLPSFLVANPGLNSGFMIPQYAAASIVNQSKVFTMPASTDSIESSQGQEDHVSMGATSATKCYIVCNNTAKILSIELFNAAQALQFRRPLSSSPLLEGFVSKFRETVPFVENDTVMYELMHEALNFIDNVNINHIN